MFNKKFYFAIVSDGKEKRVANWSCWLTCATSLRSLLTHIQSQPTILLPFSGWSRPDWEWISCDCSVPCCSNWRKMASSAETGSRQSIRTICFAHVKRKVLSIAATWPLPPTKSMALRMIIASILSKKRYKRCIQAEKIAKNSDMSVLVFAM